MSRSVILLDTRLLPHPRGGWVRNRQGLMAKYLMHKHQQTL